MKRHFFVIALAQALCFGAGHYDATDGGQKLVDVGDDVQLNMGNGRSPDKNALALSVAVTEEYMVIGARGGFLPNVYFRVLDYQYSSRYVSINKESEEDPGRVIWAVYSSRDDRPDSVYVDENNQFLSAPGTNRFGMEGPHNLELPSPGTYLATLAPNSVRKVWSGDAVIAPLSAFDVLAKDLAAIHQQYSDLEDVDDILLVINDSFYGNNRLHELRPLMGAIKGAGFENICLAFLGDDSEARAEASQEATRELFSPLGLNPSWNCSASLLTAQTKTASEAAYNLMRNQKFTKDIDKVLRDVAKLQKTGKTVLGGRRVKTDGDLNEEREDRKEIGDGLAGLFGGGGGGIATKAKGNIKTPSARDIDMGAGGGSRSAADIMKVIRQRTPGLRHIYNKFLKKKPGFQGKVTVRLTIAPGGEVISISVVSSTTGYGEFDDQIKSAVGNWTFSKVKSGNTTVTIPFTFSE